jgi:transposase-like protein
MSKERKVYTYQPGGWFDEVESPPIVNEEVRDNVSETQNSSEPTEVIESQQNTSETNQTSEETTSVEGSSDSAISTPEESTTETAETDTSGEATIQEATSDSEEAEPVTEGEPQGEPETTEETEGVEIPKTDNFYSAAVARMTLSGELPKDFQLPEDLSDDEADVTIFNAYKENLKPTARQELFTEFQNEIKKKGWSQSTLEYASMLENGVSESELRQITDYRTLASIDITKMDEDDKSDYVHRMYQDRNWKESEIKRAINSAIDEGELDTLSTEATDYFKNRKEEYDREKKLIAEQNMRQKEQVAQYQQSIVSEIFNNKELAGEKFTEDQLDDFEDALYEKKIPVQYNGQVYQVSEFDQFDAALKDNFALKLWLFKKYKFRDSDIEQIKAEAKREAEESTIVKWGKKTRKIEQEQQKEDLIGATTNTPKVKASQTGGSTYIFEGGSLKEVPKI